MNIVAVAGDDEQRLLGAGAQLLAECLDAATGFTNKVGLTFLPAVRSDFLAPVAPPVADEVHARGLVPQGVRNYQGPLYQPGRRIVVLSLLADVVQPALRHRQERYRFLPLADWQRGWTP